MTAPEKSEAASILLVHRAQRHCHPCLSPEIKNPKGLDRSAINFKKKNTLEKAEEENELFCLPVRMFNSGEKRLRMDMNRITSSSGMNNCHNNGA